MLKCRYCNTSFNPRPQVKHPIACNDSCCQKKRQRDNEKSWHSENKHRYDPKYHYRKRRLRFQALENISKTFVNAVRTGMTLIDPELRLEYESFSLFLLSFISQLGIRRVNKFWPAVKS